MILPVEMFVIDAKNLPLHDVVVLLKEILVVVELVVIVVVAIDGCCCLKMHLNFYYDAKNCLPRLSEKEFKINTNFLKIYLFLCNLLFLKIYFFP